MELSHHFTLLPIMWVTVLMRDGDVNVPVAAWYGTCSCWCTSWLTSSCLAVWISLVWDRDPTLTKHGCASPFGNRQCGCIDKLSLSFCGVMWMHDMQYVCLLCNGHIMFQWFGLRCCWMTHRLRVDKLSVMWHALVWVSACISCCTRFTHSVFRASHALQV